MCTSNNGPIVPDLVVSGDSMDDVINVFKKDVDRTLLRENLKLTVEQRIRKAQAFHRSIDGWRGIGRPGHDNAGQQQAEGNR